MRYSSQKRWAIHQIKKHLQENWLAFEALANWIDVHFRYIPDWLWGFIDIDLPSWVIYLRKGDDCDGWAKFFYEMALRKGWDAWRVIIWTKRISCSHVIALFSINDGWRLFDTGGLHNDFFATSEEAIKYVCGIFKTEPIVYQTEDTLGKKEVRV